MHKIEVLNICIPYRRIHFLMKYEVHENGYIGASLSIHVFKVCTFSAFTNDITGYTQ